MYNIKVNDKYQQDRIDELRDDAIDFIRAPSFRNNIVGRAIVPESYKDWFESRLNILGIENDVYIEDLQK